MKYRDLIIEFLQKFLKFIVFLQVILEIELKAVSLNYFTCELSDSVEL